MKKNPISLSEQDDLLITPYLNEHALPCVLRDMLSLAPSDSQRDILLLASLTSISSIMPKISFRYGNNGKTYYANLQTFIMAAAASGKGIASLARDLVDKADRETQFLLPGDSSYPAFFQQLTEQNGRGLLFETEGSVITDTWRSAARSYNTALRQAAEHETISRARVGKETLYIAMPQLSTLITGTFDQFHAFIPSVQNGFFSRQLIYVCRSQVGFQSSVFRALAQDFDPVVDTTLARCQNTMKAMFVALNRRKTDRQFCLTAEQIKKMASYFEQEYAPLVNDLGPAFHASVVRMGITCARIMMILATLRAHDEGRLMAEETLTASEADFDAALLICGKLLLHAADAFTQIHGDTEQTVPESRSSVQRTTFFAQLPEEFTKDDMNKLCTQSGIIQRTAEYWLARWIEDGTLTKPAYGVYRKTA